MRKLRFDYSRLHKWGGSPHSADSTSGEGKGLHVQPTQPVGRVSMSSGLNQWGRSPCSVDLTSGEGLRVQPTQPVGRGRVSMFSRLNRWGGPLPKVGWALSHVQLNDSYRYFISNGHG